MEALKYPIGKFEFPQQIDANQIKEWINDIDSLPTRLFEVLDGVRDDFLDTPYRPEGWTVRQLVHHIVDSHINSYIRFKWTLTEDGPTIKAYNEKDWAELPEAKNGPIEVSLNLLKALHIRWVLMLRELSETDLEKYFIHPETGRQIPLKANLALYAWHGNHHLAHINNLKNRLNQSND